ncbi:RodZ domain-containing protein [Allohahella marinimesophila]|uniref:HTH cro/C1-type domain-containing protein n=1 Tax=Allohahella marinimesophila TaxID=1054972 RepID=A0ABP7P724_9GAMM
MSASRESDDASSPSATPPPREQRSASIPVGQKLAAAREREGLSVRETAERLHVVTRYVTAIESGEYTVLPGVVFLKGYVRAYARIVGLDEDALSQALEAELQIRDDVHDHATKPLPHEPRPKSNSMAILAGLFALALVALVAFLLVRPDPIAVPSATTGPYDTDTPVEGDLPVTDTPRQPEIDEAPGSVDGMSQTFEDEALDPVVEEEIPEEATEDFSSMRRGLYTTPEADAVSEPGIEQTAESVPVESVQDGRGVGEAATGRAAAIAPSAESAGMGTPGAGMTDARVTVVFTGDCWFDIRAANDERTVGLYREGQSLTFSGPLPMEVIVGAVGATQISVNGQPLDFSRYRVRNNRVEFTITSETLQ